MRFFRPSYSRDALFSFFHFVSILSSVTEYSRYMLDVRHKYCLDLCLCCAKKRKHCRNVFWAVRLITSKYMKSRLDVLFRYTYGVEVSRRCTFSLEFIHENGPHRNHVGKAMRKFCCCVSLAKEKDGYIQISIFLDISHNSFREPKNAEKLLHLAP